MLDVVQVTRDYQISGISEEFGVYTMNCDPEDTANAQPFPKCWAGGPLSETNGDMLVAAGVNLAIIYGTTEVGILNKVMDLDFSSNGRSDGKKPEDWAWMQLDDRVKPRWIDQGDGTYELQVLVSRYEECCIRGKAHVANNRLAKRIRWLWRTCRTSQGGRPATSSSLTQRNQVFGACTCIIRSIS